MKKNTYSTGKSPRQFKGLLKIYFWIGVNIISLPVFHAHELSTYKYTSI